MEQLKPETDYLQTHGWLGCGCKVQTIMSYLGLIIFLTNLVHLKRYISLKSCETYVIFVVVDIIHQLINFPWFYLLCVPLLAIQPRQN